MLAKPGKALKLNICKQLKNQNLIFVGSSTFYSKTIAAITKIFAVLYSS